MITSWMLYALVVGALVVIAALVLERVAVTRGWPTRFVWAAGLVLASALPVANAVRQLIPHETGPIPIMPFVVTMPAVVAQPSGYDWTRALNRGLEATWATMSILLLVRLAWAMIGLRRSRRAWPMGEIDGTPVRLAPNVGPAVIGLRSMDVVLPEWIVTLDAPLRAIVLRHENEHRRARDPHLLFGAALGVAVMPWNPAMWFAARRLRLSIEIDCDQRVLRAHPSLERYAMLMLTIAQRRGVAPTLFAPMLSESATQLERRIVAMRSTTRRLARGTAIAASALAVGVIAFACSLQSDNPTSPKPSANAVPKAAASTPGYTSVYKEFAVKAEVTPVAGNPAPRYPDALRAAGIEGSVLVMFVVDTSGHPDMSSLKVIRSTDEAFTTAVRNALPNMKFKPAEIDNGRKVKQLLQMPFEFNLAGHAARANAAVETQASRDGRGVRALQPVIITGAIGGPKRVSNAALPPDVYYEYQVEKPVSPRPMNPAPRYPDAMRVAHIEGEVLAQFIVNENGRPDMSSFGVLKSSDSLFTQAVMMSLPNMQFNPALVGGKAVKQLVQMPFQFNLSKD